MTEKSRLGKKLKKKRKLKNKVVIPYHSNIFAGGHKFIFLKNNSKLSYFFQFKSTKRQLIKYFN